MKSALFAFAGCALYFSLGALGVNGGILYGGECTQRQTDLEAQFALGDATATPGSQFSIPLTVKSNAENLGLQFSIDFDEEILEGLRIQMDPIYEEADFVAIYINNDNASPGNGGVDEGYLTGGVLFQLMDSDCPTAPPNVETELMRIHFTISPDAPVGVTHVAFMDGGRPKGTSPPLYNAACIAFEGSAENVCPDMAASFIFVNGRINIIVDVAVFIRGDSNLDSTVNITDALATLGYLFYASEQLPCLDAADANDDGYVNISDPVRTLMYLFRGGISLPPPTKEEPGEDQTEDSLGCGSSS